MNIWIYLPYNAGISFTWSLIVSNILRHVTTTNELNSLLTMLSAATRSATFLSASCYVFSPHWIGKTKDSFPSLCCNESNTFEITLSVLLTGSLNKVQKISKHHLRSLPTEMKKSARWTPRSKKPVTRWGRKLPLSLIHHHAMKHTGAWGYCLIQSWHYVKVICQLHVPPALPPKNAPPITIKQISGWASEPVDMCRWTEKYLVPAGIRTLGRSNRSMCGTYRY